MTSEKEDFDSELTSEVLRKITKEKLKQLHYSKYIAYKIHARLLLLEIILSFWKNDDLHLVDSIEFSIDSDLTSITDLSTLIGILKIYLEPIDYGPYKKYI